MDASGLGVVCETGGDVVGATGGEGGLPLGLGVRGMGGVDWAADAEDWTTERIRQDGVDF